MKKHESHRRFPRVAWAKILQQLEFYPKGAMALTPPSDSLVDSTEQQFISTPIATCAGFAGRLNSGEVLRSTSMLSCEVISGIENH